MSIQMSEDNVAYIDQGNGYHIRLEIGDVTDEFYIEKARKELNETPENTEIALKVLRDLLSGLFNNNTQLFFFVMRKLKCQVYVVKV